MRNGAPLWLVVLLCAVAAPLIGLLDYRATEVQPTVFMLLAFSGAISFLQPRYAWVVALMLGLSIIETHFIGEVLGKMPATAASPKASTLLALIPAAVGAAAGGVLGVGKRSRGKAP